MPSNNITPQPNKTQQLFFFTAAVIVCLPMGNAYAQQYFGRPTRSDYVQACNEAGGSQAGRLIRMSGDIASDTLGCDFQRFSIAAKLSRACQIRYGGNPVFKSIVLYDRSNGGEIPRGRRTGCFSF
jgi:hypothetical protein